MAVTYRATRDRFVATDGDTEVGAIDWTQRGHLAVVTGGRVATPGSGVWRPLVEACARYLADEGYIFQADEVVDRGTSIRWGKLLVLTDGYPDRHAQVLGFLRDLAPIGQTRRVLAVVREADADAVETAFGKPGWFSVPLVNAQGAQVARAGQWRDPDTDDELTQRFVDAGVPTRFATIRTSLDDVSGSDRLLLFDADAVSLADVLERFGLTASEREV